MLNEELIDKLVEILVTRIEEVNSFTLNQIGKTIGEIGELTPTSALKLEQILKYGGNYDKIVRKIIQLTRMNTKDIESIFEEVAKKDYQFAEQFYKYKSIKYIPYEENEALKDQVKALAKITKETYINLSNTSALGFSVKDNEGNIIFKSLSETYRNMVDKAILSVAQGKSTFQDEMYRSLKEIGSSGIKTINYESGRSMRLDSAIRMNLKSALSNLHNELQKQIGEEFGSDGVEISVHENPAEDHQEAQGRQFTNEEFEKLQSKGYAKDYTGKSINLHKELKRIIASRLSFRPISEYNCYHYIFSIVLGVSEPEYTDKQLNNIIKKNNKGFKFEGKKYSMYEGTQLQRQIETEVRKQKDIQILAKASGNKDLINESQTKITQLTNKYRELSKISGLSTKMQRMRVPNYKRVKI